MPIMFLSNLQNKTETANNSIIYYYYFNTAEGFKNVQHLFEIIICNSNKKLYLEKCCTYRIHNQ